MRTARRFLASVAPTGILCLVVCLAGVVVLYKGVFHVSQIGYEDRIEFRQGQAMVAWGAVILLVASIPLFLRGRRVIATLTASPGIVGGVLVTAFPESLFPLLSAMILIPTAVVATLIGCFRRGPRPPQSSSVSPAPPSKSRAAGSGGS